MVEQSEILEKSTSVKISFGVKKKEEKRVVTITKRVVEADVDSDEEREKEKAEMQAKRRKMTHFEDGSIIGDEDAQKTVEVIPMVVEHDWRTQKLLEKEKDGTITDEERAKLALLVQPTSDLEKSAENEKTKIVVSGGVNESEDADYSAVSIENFGLAILRGCNWKDGDGIGKNPQKVPLRLPNRRPPGLGLGAKPKVVANKSVNNAENGKEETIGEIKVGSCIKIVDGRNKGRYGKVEGRDDDTSSLFVRLAIGSKSIKVSLFAVSAVSSKEYERDSKCLNKDDYDKEKEKIEKQRIKHDENPSTSRDNSSKPSENQEKREEELWARSDLVVRFIDPDYKEGRLYNQKVRIIDVAGRKDVTIEDDRRNTYYNIRQSWLETVIPRTIGEKIMIVQGKRRGTLGIMMDKDKRKEKVTVKLISKNETISAYFEDVCAVKVDCEEDYE